MIIVESTLGGVHQCTVVRFQSVAVAGTLYEPIMLGTSYKHGRNGKVMPEHPTEEDIQVPVLIGKVIAKADEKFR